ncbi:hypothetical protein F3Y22_tig00111208pilonHSYRG00115 [Hibiscus syriacus]|uniref:Uncharacterized protein n=1 Tax=Hibiscus syriacus TaxID=106335 RepID=A0A6A2YVH3_HIBSY|nr:hypothetical protein F3Y22_tig00111208pilonHSYRG00115 [Hibiscus syriacus]
MTIMIEDGRQWHGRVEISNGGAHGIGGGSSSEAIVGRSGIRPAYDNFIGFFHAIDWKIAGGEDSIQSFFF